MFKLNCICIEGLIKFTVLPPPGVGELVLGLYGADYLRFKPPHLPSKKKNLLYFFY